MNTIFLRKGVFWLPSMATLAVLSSLSASAQTVDKVSSHPSTGLSATVASPKEFSTELDTASQNLFTETTETFTVTSLTKVQQFQNAAIQEKASVTPTPVPGTVATSSAMLTSEFIQPTSQTTSQPSPSKVAQSDIDLGRTTRGGSSYIGVAANIGLSGDGGTSLGDGNFAVVSKIGLTNSISVRPSAVFGHNTTILLPITYDFSFKSADAFSEPLAIAPYIGVGGAYKTGDDSQFAFLISGGIDVPLTPQFTATAAINAGFFDQTDVGLLLGVGYNFSGL